MRRIIRGISGPHQGAVYVLDGRATLGRAADAHVQIPDPTVSRQHAKLVVADDGSVVLTDLSSDNGTYVEGSRIERRRLVQGDRFRIGEAEYELDIVPLSELQSSGIFARKVGGALALRRTAVVPIVALEGSVDAKVSPHAELGFIGPASEEPEPGPALDPEPTIEASTVIEVTSLDSAPAGVHVYAARTEHSVAWSAERYGLHIVLDRMPESFADRLAPPRPDEASDRRPTAEIPRLELESIVDPRTRDTVELPVPARPSPTSARPREPDPDPPTQRPFGPGRGSTRTPMLGWSRGDGLQVLRDVLQFRTLQQRFLRGQALTGEQRTRFLALSRQLQAVESDGRQPEARRYGRFACELGGRVAPWGPRLRVLEASLADVGAGGASVRLGAGKLRVGEAVWLAVDVSEPSAAAAVVIRSRVVWAQPQSERAGLMFTGDVLYEESLDAALKSVGKR